VRLDLALIERHPGLSRRKAREAIEKGQVAVDGRMVREPGSLLSTSARVSWDPNKKALSRVRSALPILYEDDSVVVVDKPAGLLSVPSGPGAEAEETALAQVRAYVGRSNPRRPYVGLVHRLDRDTSGALLFAKSPESRQALIALFSRHGMERHYSALVAGRPKEDAGEVDAPIKDTYEGGRRGVARGDEPSRPARTLWRVVERFAGAALLDVELETGRQHQARIHLAHVRLPVLGDTRYGREATLPGLRLRRQMLHARRLAFTHPLTGRRVEAESPLPEDFRAALQVFRAHPAPEPLRPRTSSVLDGASDVRGRRASRRRPSARIGGVVGERRGRLPRR
jgi:23S rRNA pseudouridine1911/1915/1917 synthase